MPGSIRSAAAPNLAANLLVLASFGLLASAQPLAASPPPASPLAAPLDGPIRGATLMRGAVPSGTGQPGVPSARQDQTVGAARDGHRLLTRGEVPAVLSRVDPVVPEEVRRRDADVVILLEVTIDGAGVPSRVRPVAGDGRFVRIAADAVRQWRFEPGAPEPIATMVGLNLRATSLHSTPDAPAADRPGVGLRPPARVREVPPQFPRPVRSLVGRGGIAGVVAELAIDPEGIVSDVIARRNLGGITEPMLAAMLLERYDARPGKGMFLMTITRSVSGR